MTPGRVRAAALASSVAALAVLFAANARYVYSDALPNLPRLTAAHIADPRFAGSTFRFDGRVRSVRAVPSGLLIIGLHDAHEDVRIDAPVFPALGCLPLKPVAGDTARVTGSLGLYQGLPQIRPLSAAHVEVLTPRASAISLPAARLSERVGETLRIGPVRADGVERFTSRRGREHVRLRFSQVRPAGPHAARADAPGSGAPSPTQGVLFQGDRTDCEERLLRSGAPVTVTARVDRFRGEPSLAVRRVAPFEPSAAPVRRAAGAPAPRGPS